MNGRDLRLFRKAKRLTQRQLADLLLVVPQMVSQMELGERPIPTRPRELYPGERQDLEPDPSVMSRVIELMAMSDAELREELVVASDPAEKGPYRL